MEKIFSNIKINNYQEERLDISLSAFEVFKRLYPYCKNIFLLESLGEEGKYNRFSYIGFDSEFMILAKKNQMIVKGRCSYVINPYTTLASHFKSKSNGDNFCGGLVGYVSYEGARYFDEAYKGYDGREFADFEFGFFLDGLKFDKKGNRCIYFHHGNSRIKLLKNLLNRSGKLDTFSYRKIAGGVGKKEHEEMVLQAKQEILAGNIFQVVLSYKSRFQLSGDTRRIYASLRQINPSPYMAYFKFGEKEIITASPELLIRVKGEQIEHLGTLAGTIKRGTTSTEDDILAKKLVSDEKEMAEHMMLVDLARNDLGKICSFGSIKTQKLAYVKRYSHVQHISSDIIGKLNSSENSLSALSACFPAGTLTGAPKVEAIKIIKRLEKEARGPYGGVVGYASLNGDAMFAIAIRSLFINGHSAYTQTGSGIVLDSDPTREYEEILNKQRAMEEALKRAQGKL